MIWDYNGAPHLICKLEWIWKGTSYKLQVTSYKLQVTSHKSQATSYKLQFTSYKLSYNLQVTSYKLQFYKFQNQFNSLCGGNRDGKTWKAYWLWHQIYYLSCMYELLNSEFYFNILFELNCESTGTFDLTSKMLNQFNDSNKYYNLFLWILLKAFCLGKQWISIEFVFKQKKPCPVSQQV